MKQEKETVKKLINYFGGQTIGSYVLVEEKFLDEDLINDIDVMVRSESSRITPIRDFMRDEGWVETKAPRYQSGYNDVDGSLIFKKEDCIPIHICRTVNLTKKWKVSDIIAAKFERAYERDLRQLRNIINKDISKLEIG